MPRLARPTVTARHRAVAVEPGVLYTPDDVWGVWRLPGRTYDLLSDSEKRTLASRIVHGFAGLRGRTCHLIVPAERYDPTRWAEQFTRSAYNPTGGFGDILAGQVEHLTRQQRWQRRVYLLVRLGDRDTGTRRRLFRAAADTVGAAYADVPADELARWNRVRDQVGQTVEGPDLRGAVCGTHEIGWLIRRTARRGGHTPDRNSYRAARYRHGHLATFETATYTVHDDAVEQTAPQTRWVAWLTYGHITDDLPFPGGEWLYAPLAGLPAEVSFRFTLAPVSTVAAKTARARNAAREQADNAAGTGEELPAGLAVAYGRLDGIEQDLAGSTLPVVVDAYPRVGVWADTRDELDDRVATVIDRYDDMGVAVHRPSHDPLALMAEAQPGGRPLSIRGFTAPYGHVMPLSTLAGSMFTATGELGDGAGWYVGVTAADGAPVHFDPHLPAEQDRPTAIKVTGQSGYGKSFFSGLLAGLTRLSGATVAVIDPANSFGRLAEFAERYGHDDHVRVATLGDEHAGALDPYALGDSPQACADLALTVCQILLPGGDGQTYEAQIAAACQQVAHRETRSLTEVAATLTGATDPKVAAVGESLRTASRSALGSLCFGRGRTAGLTPAEGFTVLQVRGLDLPERDTPRAEYTAQDRQSTAVMLLLTQFVYRTMTRLPGRAPKLVVLDEAWAIMGHPDGRRLVLRIVRDSRRLNTVPVFVSQSIRDTAGDEWESNIGTRVAFHANADAEVHAVLAAHGLDQTAAHVDMVRDLGRGQCLVTADGRSGVMTVDATFAELADALETNPLRAGTAV